MNKLKTKQTKKLINYQQFLKNNYLKTNRPKFKNLVFENQILYTNLNLEAQVIELNLYENIYLPLTLTKVDDISTIALKYENILLFNYDLTYDILYQFNKIMFQNLCKKNKTIIQGRLLGGNWNNKKIFISIFGFVFGMKPINLTNSLNFKNKFKFNQSTNKGFYKKKFNPTRLINCYKLKYLNFQINNLPNLKKKELSRLSYLQTLRQNKNV